MLEKGIPYYNIIMKWKRGKTLSPVTLDKAYELKTYTEGDEAAWARIMVAVGEFDSLDEAGDYFSSEYAAHMEAVKSRMLFLKAPSGELIGTTTLWWRYTGERRDPTLEWVALLPLYQGKGLGRYLVTEAMDRMIALEGDQDFYLHTQTWSYKAVSLYLRVGYEFSKDETFSDYVNDYDAAMTVIQDKIR